MATIAIIGTGYVGLTSGACFAHLGHDVVCADVDTDKVARLSAGEVRTVEAGPVSYTHLTLPTILRV